MSEPLNPICVTLIGAHVLCSGMPDEMAGRRRAVAAVLAIAAFAGTSRRTALNQWRALSLPTLPHSRYVCVLLIA